MSCHRMEICQPQVNGYFGGYIGKRQKCGKLGTRKCVDKMSFSETRRPTKAVSNNSELIAWRR